MTKHQTLLAHHTYHHSERSAYATEHSSGPSVSQSVRKVYCDKTADWIQMSFGVVRGVGPRIHVLDEGSCAPKGRDCFGNFSAFVPPLGPALVVEWLKPPAAVHAGQGSLPVRVEALVHPLRVIGLLARVHGIGLLLDRHRGFTCVLFKM